MSHNTLYISKFQLKHGTKYDYSKVEYKTAKTKVIVICKTHGEFLITPNNHLSGYGCPKCSGRGFTKEEMLERFIHDANEIHNNFYDYSKVSLNNKNLHIVCPIHGDFYQSKIAHVTNKSGCPQCGKTKRSTTQLLPLDKFIAKANKKHKSRYTYNNVVYQGAHKKVNVTCPIHGDFMITPANHWSNGVGCPSCFQSNPSKGESRINDWLTLNNIPFESQKSFKDLYYKSKNGRLKYDFYIPLTNLLIEFDGEYHYIPISFSKHISASDQHALTQIRDSLKTEYAKNNGFKLLRIRFDNDIESVLATALL